MQQNGALWYPAIVIRAEFTTLDGIVVVCYAPYESLEFAMDAQRIEEKRLTYKLEVVEIPDSIRWALQNNLIPLDDAIQYRRGKG